MQIYNTLTKSIEEVQAYNPPNLGFYACGPTVYDYTHIGHLRSYTMNDVLVRTLRHGGFTVTHVENITDVGHLASDEDTGEDKMEKGAVKYQMTVWDLAKKFEDYFFYANDLMGNKRPDISCRATDHIQEQLNMVLELEKRGFTYVIEGDGVYFDTSKFPDYGKMAQLNLAQQQAGARVEQVAGKRNPSDFALWKFEKPGENRAMVWESPWSPRSYPGWHIECSAMSMKYLGEQFEIHTGGIDHIPVHHTNEIAQAEAATGKKPFVRYWVHYNFLMIEGQKMSKSLGNLFTIDDVMERGFAPQALRLLFLTSHYRSQMNFTWENLAGMQKQWERLVELMTQYKKETSRTVLSEDKLQKLDEFRKQFFGLMENDLRTPEALVTMWNVVKSNIPGSDKYDLVLELDEVLGLGIREAVFDRETGQSTMPGPEITPEVQKLLDERQKAREKKKWDKADELRTKIEEMGYRVVDGQDRQKVTLL